MWVQIRNIPDSFKKIVIVNGTKKPWRNEEGGEVTENDKIKTLQYK